MKTKVQYGILALALGSMTLSSCIGSFGLFNSVLKWNKGLCRSKFVNEIVFFVISPFYALCGVADLFVLNSIEFWTGSNPINVAEGKVKNVMGQDGKLYAVKNLKNGYEITAPDGQKSYYTYDEKTDVWSVTANGKTQPLFRGKGDGTVETFLPDGRTMDVSLNEEGLDQLRTAVAGSLYMALR